MTKFRYQAVLHKAGEQIAKTELEFLESPSGRWNLREITALLRQHGNVGFRNVPNLRLAGDLRIASLLADSDTQAKLSQLRSEARNQAADGVDPEDLFGVAAELNKNVEISWAACHADGAFDAAFTDPRTSPRDAINWPEPPPSAFLQVASSPRQQKLFEQLRETLAGHLSAQQAGEPAHFVFVHALPKQSNGATDEEALRCFLGAQARGHFAAS
jgi:hypothetical protein